jgi:hypothetical protein
VGYEVHAERAQFFSDLQEVQSAAAQAIKSQYQEHPESPAPPVSQQAVERRPFSLGTAEPIAIDSGDGPAPPFSQSP